MLKLKKHYSIISVLSIIAINILFAPTAHANSQPTVTDITVNRATYQPNEMEMVHFNVNLNANQTQGQAKLQLKIYHLNQLVHATTKTINLTGQVNVEDQWQWKAPKRDYIGYRAEISVNGHYQKSIAIDVSSDTNKFPRYGAITQFTPGTDNTSVLTQMKNWNINTLQYYDAYQTPQNPIPDGKYQQTWTQTWAPWISETERTKSGSVIQSTVKTGHQLGMQAMFYNMIYAITGNPNDTEYLKSIGVKPEWLLYRQADNQLFQHHMANYLSPSDPQYQSATQTYLDIKNPEVVDWIVKRMLPVLENMNFDGWHGDTIGNNKAVYYSKNVDGSIKNEYAMQDELGQFANAVKARLHSKKFVLNAISYYGEDNVAKSKSDFDYAETWRGTYQNIVDEIKHVNAISGKSLVIPAYQQAGYPTKGANFNPNSVLMLDAMVNAAGGSRMEVVDGHHLLVGEFFPSKDLVVSEALKNQIYNYQTFMTAYENLLRDGQKDNHRLLKVYNQDHQIVSTNRITPNHVYAYARSSNHTETIQLINLLGVNSIQWKDATGTQAQPQILNNFTIKYYPKMKANQFKHVYVTSPDGKHNNQSIPLSFKWGHDKQGKYIKLTVPQLQRWDMLYLK